MGRIVWRWARRVGIAFVILALLGMAALAALGFWERTYIYRLWTHPKNIITEVAWFVPREPVPGGGGAAPAKSDAG